ncbi:adenylate/guanylate cyclase domain-containing protein [Roseiterribacter gracilis]|uniref:Adenylate cyclase n=1 Tax=Roseiterribacter gracilis TaxID=2812848 RepID=A0A8S8X9V0_9PROT|nr:adenylate cyclase [Rhodospirillales bacterium TMPK1]
MSLRTLLLGPPPPPLPTRVADELERQQRASEITIGWVQLLGVAFLALLDELTPASLDVGAGAMLVVPVRATFAVYAVLTAARLWLAYKNRLTPPLLATGIAIDVAVLLALIVSIASVFPNPEQSALKVSLQAWLPCVIALRALRFDPRWVAWAGLFAAGGWLLLVVLASSAAPEQVTEDARSYLSGAGILFAAEADKIAGLLALTAVLSLALARARATLARAVVAASAQAELGRFFAPSVAARIVESDRVLVPGGGELRPAAIAMFDLRGYSIAARQLDPHALLALLGEFHALVLPIVRSGGGSVDKFLGDGILVSFGAVEPSSTYAADALQTVRDAVEAGQRWSADRAARGLVAPSVGAAVAVGEVLVGAIGVEDRLEFTVIGDAVNTAAKLEKHNKEERVRALASGEAFALARQQGSTLQLELRAARAVAGLDTPMDLAVLVP